MAIRRIQGTQNWLSEHNKALKNGYPNKIRHSKMAIRTYQGTQKWLSEHIRASKTGYPRKCDTATSRNQGIHFWLSTRNQGTQIWLSTAILGIQIWLSIQKTMASSFGYPPKNIGIQNWLSEKTVAMNKTLDYPLWLLQMNAYVSIFNHFCIRESIWSVSI